VREWRHDRPETRQPEDCHFVSSSPVPYPRWTETLSSPRHGEALSAGPSNMAQDRVRKLRGCSPWLGRLPTIVMFGPGSLRASTRGTVRVLAATIPHLKILNQKIYFIYNIITYVYLSKAKFGFLGFPLLHLYFTLYSENTIFIMSLILKVDNRN